LEELENGSSLKVTIANWLSPNGELIVDKGLKPDVEVIMTDEDYNEERDPQLDKALEIIKGIK
jgi:carboxyl-terminal processing protease